MEVNQNQKKNSNEFKVTGNWENQSKELKGKFSQLTDSDLKYESGKENELLERVEKRLNKKREEVINILNNTQAAPVK
ncbi:MAG: hypothetical protein JJT77_05720 [Crocinitomicaceae bacterium]|nr:hypothetical protein [Crocinitomicaceae bacterium]